MVTLDGHTLRNNKNKRISAQDYNRYRAHIRDLSGPQCSHPINHDILFYGGICLIMRLNCLLDDIIKKGVLGKTVAYVYVLEFQKRGLPHAHLLVILANEDIPVTADDYDLIVSAELPSKETQPIIFSTVTSNMIHGPCGPGSKNHVV